MAVKKSRKSVGEWAKITEDNFITSKEILEEAQSLRDDLINGNDNVPPISEIQDRCATVQELETEIHETYENLISDENSISNQLVSLLENLETRIQNIDKKQKNILDFEKKLFGHEVEEDTGEINEETGEELTKTIRVEGIKDKFDNILKSLSDQKKQKVADLENLHQHYDEEISKLLPKATSAGLAHAYEKTSNQYSVRASVSHFLFVITGLLLAFIGVLYSFPITINIFESFFESSKQFEQFKVLFSPTSLLPVTVPLIWIAFVFQSKAKTYTRMHIEYQHKANLCKTFDGLKREASEKMDDNLGKELLQAMVDSNAHNPAKNLDNIKSKTPFTKTYETAADKILDTLKDIKEILRK